MALSDRLGVAVKQEVAELYDWAIDVVTGLGCTAPLGGRALRLSLTRSKPWAEGDNFAQACRERRWRVP